MDVFKEIESTPCLRNSLLTGMLAGTLLGIHSRRQLNPLKKAVDWGYLGFLLCSSTSWFLCNREHQERKRVIEAAMTAQGIKKAP